MAELDPISPAEAKRLYHQHRQDEISETTQEAHDYRLSHFVRWCEDVVSIDNMNDVSGRTLLRYQSWRKDDGDLNTVSCQTQFSTLRTFIEFCERMEAVEQGTSEKIRVPSPNSNEESRDRFIEQDQAETILDHLRKFKYGSRDHILFAVFWETGARISGVRAIDVDDVDVEEQIIELRHRPEGGTALKNGKNGERPVHISTKLCDAIDDYLQHNRIDSTDDCGRKPLFTSKHGRLAKTSIRRSIYKLTQPCFYSNECPHDREIEDCEARGYGDRSLCPSKFSPHEIRRGSITSSLLNETPEWAVSERTDVSAKVLEKHYDGRTERELLEKRRQFFEDTEETA
jgi:site-specific recombinase XerD